MTFGFPGRFLVRNWPGVKTLKAPFPGLLSSVQSCARNSPLVPNQAVAAGSNSSLSSFEGVKMPSTPFKPTVMTML